jgi:hypothetical protein
LRAKICTCSAIADFGPDGARPSDKRINRESPNNPQFTAVYGVRTYENRNEGTIFHRIESKHHQFYQHQSLEEVVRTAHSPNNVLQS